MIEESFFYTTNEKPNLKRRLFSNDESPNLEKAITKSCSLEKHVCTTCKTEICDEISRVLLLRDKDGGPLLLCYHFFFPCWDFELLIQKYPNLVIDKAGYSIPETLKIKESSLNDLQKNLDLWSLPSQKII